MISRFFNILKNRNLALWKRPGYVGFRLIFYVHDTCKVGDTITATVAPSNATNVVYAWAADGVAIEGATTATYTVVEADLGKKISVTVTGDEASTATAETDAVKAQETEKVTIASAKQTKAAEFEVVLTKAASTGYTFTVTKGTTAQTITTAFSEDGKTATLTLGTAIQAADYVIRVVNTTDATEFAETTVTGETATLKSIDFLGDELILADSTLTKASTTLVGYNTFDEKVALTGSLTITSTKGKATYTASTNKVVVDTSATSGLLFTPGEQVTLTGVYVQGNVPLQVSKSLTVSARATLTEFEAGDIATTRAALKDAKINLTNLGTNTYYFPIKTAKDQYGNSLSADELDKMLVDADNTTGNLYITPYLSSGSYAYVNGFTELTDKTIAMQIYKGGLNSPGKQIFSITGVSGYTGSLELDVVDDPYIATLNVSAPTFYDGDKAEITITAVDQDGNAYDLYDKVKTSGGKKLEFKDQNHLTTMGSYIEVTDGALTFKENSSKKTITFFYQGSATSATVAKSVVATIMPASAIASNQTWTVQPATSVAGIKSFDKDLSVNPGGKIFTGTVTNFTWLDSSGAALDNTASTGKLPNYTANIEALSGVESITVGKYYSVAVSPTGTTSWNILGGDVVAPTSGNVSSANYTATITVSLYDVTKANTATAKAEYTELAKKTFTATANDGTTDHYTATLKKTDATLYVNKDSVDITEFDVKAVDNNGVARDFTGYTVTVDSDLAVSGKVISGKNNSISSAGTATAQIWVGGKSVVTLDVPYDVAAPAAQGVSTWDSNNNKASAKDTFESVTGLTLGSNGAITLVDGTETYVLQISDQYNLPMANTSWNLGGSPITASSYPAGTRVLTATSAKVSGSWNITNSIAFSPVVPAATSVNTASELKSALDKAAASSAADVITIGKDITLGTGVVLTIAKNDTLIIPEKITLTSDTSGNTYNIIGTMTVNGSWIDDASDNINLSGTVNGSGHWTNSNSIKDSTGAVISLTGSSWEIAHSGSAFANGGTGVTVKNNVIITGGASAKLNLSGGTAENLTVTVAGSNNDAVVELPASTTAKIISGSAEYSVTTASDAGVTTITQTSTEEIKAKTDAGTAEITNGKGTVTDVTTTETTAVTTSYEDLALELINSSNEGKVNQNSTCVGNYYWGDGSSNTGIVKWDAKNIGWTDIVLSAPAIEVDSEKKIVTFSYAASGDLYRTNCTGRGKDNSGRYYTIGYISKNPLNTIISSDKGSITVGGNKYSASDLDANYLTNCGWYEYNKSKDAWEDTFDKSEKWVISFAGADNTTYAGYQFVHEIDMSEITLKGNKSAS